MGNVYFDLTREFNREGRIALLASGQAVVYYRTAIMSKDGDWVLDETPEACARVLEVLAARDARYRPGAPLDVRWLAGGWSSHFEFSDDRGRRVRCDFLCRAPRVEPERLRALFDAPLEPGGLSVIDLESLILMKQTQRAKDYPVIGELARLLPEPQELIYTTDPDRIQELAGDWGEGMDRPAVRVARRGGSREEVVVALAVETDARQRADRERIDAYLRCGRAYLSEVVRRAVPDLPLGEAHPALIDLARELLPLQPPWPAAQGGAGCNS